jgi:hypothetical protein
MAAIDGANQAHSLGEEEDEERERFGEWGLLESVAVQVQRSSEDSLVLVAFSYWLVVQPRGPP